MTCTEVTQTSLLSPSDFAMVVSHPGYPNEDYPNYYFAMWTFDTMVGHTLEVDIEDFGVTRLKTGNEKD